MPLIKKPSRKELEKKDDPKPMPPGDLKSLAVALSVKPIKKMATGGMIDESDYDKEERELDEMHEREALAKGGIAAAIMHRQKSKMMASGGLVDDAEAPLGEFDELSEDAVGEDFDTDVSEPMDSNEHSEKLDDEDSHDMVSKIMKKHKKM